MLHFTSLNIVHRDLKPSNIFIDVNGDVRIGDFGLAVNQDLVPESSANIAVPTTDGGDITLDIGTSLYIPPESMSRRPKAERTTKYSNKIDMYSLGVVFFELWHRFSTGMERIQVLRELRKPETKLPSSWDPKKLERQTRIVKWCLEHDPEVRASPKDLLESGLLPPRIGDDSIVETIRMLSTPGTPHAQKLLSALFDQTIEEKLRKDFSFDFYDGQGVSTPLSQLSCSAAHLHLPGSRRERSVQGASAREAQPSLPSQGCRLCRRATAHPSVGRLQGSQPRTAARRRRHNYLPPIPDQHPLLCVRSGPCDVLLLTTQQAAWWHATRP